MPIELNGTWTAYTNANITSIYQLFQYGNSVTGNMFGPLILMMFFVVSIIAQKNRSMKDILPVSGFITAIVSMGMSIAGLVGPEAVIALIAVTAGSILYSMSSD